MLKYAFLVLRNPKSYYGDQTMYKIPVYKCENDSCLFKYTRVLPDIFTPNKHYITEVIENYVDDTCTPDPYLLPCKKTVNRWKYWIAGNRNHIDGLLKSIGSRLEEFGEELLNSADSLIDQLRSSKDNGWLSYINRIMYNFGSRLLTDGQLAEVSTVLEIVPPSYDLGSPQEEESDHGVEGNPKLAGRHSTEAVRNHTETVGSGP